MRRNRKPRALLVVQPQRKQRGGPRKHSTRNCHAPRQRGSWEHATPPGSKVSGRCSRAVAVAAPAAAPRMRERTAGPSAGESPAVDTHSGLFFSLQKAETSETRHDVGSRSQTRCEPTLHEVLEAVRVIETEGGWWLPGVREAGTGRCDVTLTEFQLYRTKSHGAGWCDGCMIM